MTELTINIFSTAHAHAHAHRIAGWLMICLRHVHFQKYLRLSISCQQSVKIYKNGFACKDAPLGRQNIIGQRWLRACSFLFCFLIIYCLPFLFGKLSICFPQGQGFCSCEVGKSMTWSNVPVAARWVY